MNRIRSSLIVHGVEIRLCWEEALNTEIVIEQAGRLDETVVTFSAQHRTEFPKTPMLVLVIANRAATDNIRQATDYRPVENPDIRIRYPHVGTKYCPILINEDLMVRHWEDFTAQPIEVFLEEYAGKPRVQISV